MKVTEVKVCVEHIHTEDYIEQRVLNVKFEYENGSSATVIPPSVGFSYHLIQASGNKPERITCTSCENFDSFVAVRDLFKNPQLLSDFFDIHFNHFPKIKTHQLSKPSKIIKERSRPIDN